MPRISVLPPATRARGQDGIPLQSVNDVSTERATVDMLMPTGTILDYAGNTAPNGFLLCYGQALNAAVNTDYQALYTVIGNTYGGTDNTNFVVPDLRGRIAAGRDNMGGSAASRLTNQAGGVDGSARGKVGGEETHVTTVAEMPGHTHPNRWRANLTRGTNGLSTNDLGGDALVISDNMPGGDTSSGYDMPGNPTIGLSAGGGGAHNNVQPTIILNKIIKY